MSTLLRWGVVGVGSAGRSRTRALRADPRSEAVCGWRGSPSAVGLPEADSLDALLEQVDAVAVCAVDSAHPSLIRRALAAGRHVLTEFPLASSRAEGEALLGEAEAAGRVLHVEHIELLGSSAALLRAHTRGVQGGRLAFTGRPRAGVAHVALANIARLHRLVDAVGLPADLRVDLREEWRLQGGFVYPDFELAFSFEHAPDLPRATNFELETAAGRLVQAGRSVSLEGRVFTPPPAAAGLFEQDQRIATARILDGASSYLSDERILDVLGLADALVA